MSDITVSVAKTEEGARIVGSHLAEKLTAEQAIVLAQRLWAEAPKAKGREDRTFTLPLPDGTSVYMRGLWPLTPDDFEAMLRLLDVMRAGLVKAEGSNVD